MKKLLGLTLFLVQVINLQAMEKETEATQNKVENPYNVQNHRGRTPLHLVPKLPKLSDISSHQFECQLAQINSEGAKIAAFMILRGARIDIKDNDGETPLSKAEALKDKLHQIYEVMTAGKVKQNFDEAIEKDMLEQFIESGKTGEWENAMTLLGKYAEEDVFGRDSKEDSAEEYEQED